MCHPAFQQARQPSPDEWSRLHICHRSSATEHMRYVATCPHARNPRALVRIRQPSIRRIRSATLAPLDAATTPPPSGSPPKEPPAPLLHPASSSGSTSLGGTLPRHADNA